MDTDDWDCEAWKREVRDPATAHNEGDRVIRRGKATAAYNIACIPTGYAWRVEYDRGDAGFGGTSWHGPCTTRAEALESALRILRYSMRGTDVEELLAGDGCLFGFMEPTPANA